MSTRAFPGNFFVAAAGASAIWLAATSAVCGANLTWDPAQSGGTAVGGGGAWNAAPDWWSGTGDQAWNNANADTAVFTGLAGSVMLGSSQSVGGIIFASTGGYALTGSSIALAGASPAIAITSGSDSIASVISGSAALSIQAGSGLLVLAASNNYTGGTSLNSGTLSVKSDAALGAAPGSPATNLTFNGGRLNFTASTSLNANRTVSLGAAGGTLSLTYNPPATGNLTKATVPGVRLLGQITGGGNLTIAGGTVANNSVNSPYLFLLDNPANNFTGTTTIKNATVINDAGVSNATNLLPTTTALNLVNSGVFAFYGPGGATQTLAGLSGDGSGLIGTANTTTPATLTINPAANASYTYGGTIGDVRVFTQGSNGTGGAALVLTFSGQGTEVLSGSKIDSGATTVASGTLSLGSGSLSGGGAVTVGINGTLAGAGVINGPTVVNGCISPSLGNSLYFNNNLTLNTGATFVLQAGGGTTGSIQNVSNLTANGPLNLMPSAIDSDTFNGHNSFQFLTWTTSGPTPGVQSNWSVLGPNVISWTGAADQLNWSNSGNWSGSNVSGGTVQAVYTSDLTGAGYLEVDGLSQSLGLSPASNAVISSSAALAVAGPTSPASVQSLTLGAGTGAANVLNLGAGPLSVTGPAGTTINATGVLNVGSGTLESSALNISGTVNLSADSVLSVAGTANVNSLGVLRVSSSGYPAPPIAVAAGGALVGAIADAFAFSASNAVTVNGQLQVAADGALTNASSLLQLGQGAAYNFTARQSSSPSLTIGCGQGLFGDLTNFTFGSTGSVTLMPNATVSASVGALPTRTQLGGAILLVPVTAADTGSFAAGDDGSTSVFGGVSLGSWTTVGGVPVSGGAPFVASNGTLNFSALSAVQFSGTVSDTSVNGFKFLLNGQNLSLTTAAALNTSNTTVGVQFVGLGNVSFPSGANPGGTAAVYSRIGSFDVLNTSGGTLPNTTGNLNLVTFIGSNNLAGKMLNVQNLTVNAVNNVTPTMIASSGTINFGAYSAMYNSGTTFTQGYFNFAPTAIYRIGNDARLTSGASFSFQTGAVVSIAEASVNTDAWSVPSNVDFVLSSLSDPVNVSGTTGIVLGDGRTLSSPWNTSQIALNVSANSAINAAPGAASVRLAGANGQTLTINGPLELGSATLIINDIPSNTLYVPANGDSDFTRQPGGSVLNGTVALGNFTSTPSVIPEVYVKGGTLRLTTAGALGGGPAMVVGAPGVEAGSATVDLYGNNTAVTSLAGAPVGAITNFGFAAATLTVAVPAASSATYAGTIADGYYQVGLSLSGSGTEVLAGPNTYSGGTIVDSGVLQIGNSAALGNGGLAADGGTLDLAGYSVAVPSFSGAAGVLVNSASGSAATLSFDQFSATEFDGSIRDGAGTTAILLNGGTLALGGTNTYTGGTTVESGELILNTNEAIADGSSLTVGDAAAFGQFVAASTTVAAGSGLNHAAPVPEPETEAMLAAGSVILLLSRMWKQRSRRPVH
jgi:fibronectin-binding autotransporter adhesin